MVLAKMDVESDDAATALAWVASNRVKSSSEAVDLLFEKHGDSEAATKVIPGLAFETNEKTEKRLRGLIESGSSDKVKGIATMALARYLGNVPGVKEMAEDNPERATQFYGAEVVEYVKGFEEKEGELESLYESVVANYGSITQRGGTLGEAAESALFAMRSLKVGLEVPDIEGADLDGVEFKLSDYRGKVVVLDFWGNW